MGFGVPLDHWFRGPLADFTREVLLDDRPSAAGFFRPEAVAALVDEHLQAEFDHAIALGAADPGTVAAAVAR